METKTAQYNDWHAWQAKPTQWLLSDESTKHLTTWSSVDDMLTYLFFQDKEAARVFNARLKDQKKEVKK